MLGVWWDLRAQIIEGYRDYKRSNPKVPALNTRNDYEQLFDMAEEKETATIFTELRGFRRAGRRHGLIGIGSKSKPFNVFLPRIDEPKGEKALNLLKNRYLSGDDLLHPRRGYAYVTGELSLYAGRPQITVKKADQIADLPPS